MATGTTPRLVALVLAAQMGRRAGYLMVMSARASALDPSLDGSRCLPVVGDGFIGGSQQLSQLGLRQQVAFDRPVLASESLAPLNALANHGARARIPRPPHSRIEISRTLGDAAGMKRGVVNRRPEGAQTLDRRSTWSAADHVCPQEVPSRMRDLD